MQHSGPADEAYIVMSPWHFSCSTHVVFDQVCGPAPGQWHPVTSESHDTIRRPLTPTHAGPLQDKSPT